MGAAVVDQVKIVRATSCCVELQDLCPKDSSSVLKVFVFQWILHTTHHSHTTSGPYQHPEWWLPLVDEDFLSLLKGASIILHFRCSDLLIS